MIPEERQVRDKTSTLTGEKIAMTIDAPYMAHIMDMLTDLYADRVMAVIREYSTNARDSHLEAKVTRPILVTTPTPLSPFFSVQDFGIGLSPADIEAIYSKYGASTKRASNDVIGMLGLGCKSGLAYADQFTLIGIKDGVRQQVLIGREADGAGTMTIVSTEATAEPNGVTIQIPAKTGDPFERKAKEFFSFWPKGSVLLNGSDPTGLGEARKLSDDVYLQSYPRDLYGSAQQDVVVMGGVPYPASLDPQNRLATSSRLVAYVPIGSVEFPPNRETLKKTPKTRATLDALTKECYAHMDAAILKDVDSQPTKRAALKAMLAWERAIRGGGRVGKYTHQGTKLPEEYRGSVLSVPGTAGYIVSRHSRYNSVMLNSWLDSIWIKNYDLGKWTAPKRKKLNKYMADTYPGTALPANYFLVTDDPTPVVGEYCVMVLDWNDIKTVKLPRNVTAANGVPARLAGSYDLLTEDGTQREVKASELVRPKVPIYWLRGNYYNAAFYLKYLYAQHDKFTLVYLPLNRVEKFQRDFPQAIDLKQSLRDTAATWSKKLKPNEQKALAMEDLGIRDIFKAMDEARLDDPRLKEAARLAKVDIDKRLDERKVLYHYSGSQNLSQNGWKNPLESYPIFDTYEFQRQPKDHREHWYLYFNAAFKAGVV